MRVGLPEGLPDRFGEPLGTCLHAAHGLRTCTPIASKGPVSRVATASMPLAGATAASSISMTVLALMHRWSATWSSAKRSQRGRLQRFCQDVRGEQDHSNVAGSFGHPRA